MNKLYKRDTTGKVRVWTTEVEGDMHRTITGVIDGKMVVSKWSQSKPKNVGRSNETTGCAQAFAESNAKHKKQLERGYFSNIADIDNVTIFKPMLANDYAKLKKPVEFPVISQPKLDGIRCIARVDGLWTRTGKPITSVPHIWEYLEDNFFREFPDLVLDGELYNHELKDDFNTITSIVRKVKHTAEDIEKSKALVQYHVYDCYDPFVTEWGLSNRRKFLYRKSGLRDGPECVQLVANHLCESEEDLDDTYFGYVSVGYEGQMVRIEGSEYQNKRSKFLLKRKEFITEEFDVVAVEEGQGNWSGCVKRFNLVNEHYVHFNAGVRGTQVQLADLLNNKKCPDWATLRYFELTPDGIPRFPVVIDYGWVGRDD
mgnify:CR=1 FL=1